MKKLLIALLAALLVVGLGACKSRVPPAEEESASESDGDALPEEDDFDLEPEESLPEEEADTEGAQEAARDFLTALQSGDSGRIREQTDYNNLLQLEEGDSEEDMLAILQRMQFEIHEAEALGTSAVDVSVTIRNADMHKVLPAFLKQAMDMEYNNATSEAPKSDAEMEGEYQKLFTGLLDQHQNDPLERRLELQLVSSGDGWRVQLGAELRSALFGDYWEAVKQVGPNAGGGQR